MSVGKLIFQSPDASLKVYATENDIFIHMVPSISPMTIGYDEEDGNVVVGIEYNPEGEPELE